MIYYIDPLYYGLYIIIGFFFVFGGLVGIGYGL